MAMVAIYCSFIYSYLEKENNKVSKFHASNCSCFEKGSLSIKCLP